MRYDDASRFLQTFFGEATAMMEEKAYRQLVAQTFKQIEDAFENVDPDLVEASRAGDVITLLFPDGMRCMISPQPPVRQVWLAARANAFHFNYDDNTQRWVDDHGRGLELMSYIRDLVKEEVDEAVPLS
jgi:CyaY protein